MSFRFLIFIAAFILWLPTYGVSAKPGAIKYIQPSGQTVTINIYGDENFHYYTSEDGFLLIEKDDTLYFANYDPTTTLSTPSQFEAVDIVNRRAECRKFLENLDRSIPRSVLIKKSRRQSRQTAQQFGLFSDADYPRQGHQKAIVILAEYPDTKFSTTYDPKDYFTRMLNGENFTDYNASGSAREYFETNSRRQFLPEFDVYGPVELPHLSYIYGMNDRDGNDRNPAQMIVDACRLLDSEVDFSQYDRNGDGLIDNVFVFYAGRGEASGGLPSTIWPHSWDVRAGLDETIILDGKILGRYACSNEWMGTKPDGIGTFVHEFSHVLGLPDLYTTSYSEAFTPGPWSVMDSGSYNNDSRTPPMYSTFERYALGWSTPLSLPATPTIELQPISSADGYIAGTSSPDEIYFIENRQQSGWDKYLPGHGMLVWHVNYSANIWDSNVVNDTPNRQYVDLIEADGTTDNNRRSAHSFPGTANVTGLSLATHPHLRSWTDKNFDFTIENISESSGKIHARVKASSIALKAPQLLETIEIDDTSFIARWQSIDNAIGYRLSVFSSFEDGHNIDENGFDSNFTNSNGWTSSSLMLSSSSENAGKNTPSLMFGAFGGFIDSPSYPDQIEQLSFWCKTYSQRAYQNPEISIYGCIDDDEDWILIRTISLEINTTQTITINNIPRDVKKIRIGAIGINGVTYYIDDCTVEYGTRTVNRLLPDYPQMIGNVTSITISGLPSGFVGAFSLEATDGENYSSPSELCPIRLPDHPLSSISTIIQDHDRDSPIAYDLQGRNIDLSVAPPGIYIIRQGSQIKKIIKTK